MNKSTVEAIFRGAGYIVETQNITDLDAVYIKANAFIEKLSITSWVNSVAVKRLQNATSTTLIITDKGKKGATWFHEILLTNFIQWNSEFSADRKILFLSRLNGLATDGVKSGTNEVNNIVQVTELQEEVERLESKLDKYEKLTVDSCDSQCMEVEVEKLLKEKEALQKQYDTLASLYHEVLGNVELREFVAWRANKK